MTEELDLVKSTILYHENNPSVEKLFKIYKENRTAARVYFINEFGRSHPKNDIIFYDFISPNHYRFKICHKTYIFNFKTNRLLSRNVTDVSYIFKNNQLYIVGDLIKKSSAIRYAKLGDLRIISNRIGDDQYRQIIEIIKQNTPWLRNFIEFYDSNYGHLPKISVASIYKHKLFNAKKIIKHLYYPLTYNIITNKFIPISVTKEGNNIQEKVIDIVSSLEQYLDKLRYIDNIENASQYFLSKFRKSGNNVSDSIIFAEKLNKKVNASWSEKRWKQVHDNMSKEIIELTYLYNNERLNIHNKFEHLIYWLKTEDNRFNIINDNATLFHEGDRFKHCVYTYSGNINKGNCVIVNFDNKYTIEISNGVDIYNKKTTLHYIAQMRGFANSSPDNETYEYVKSLINEYNENFQYLSEYIVNIDYRIEKKSNTQPYVDNNYLNWLNDVVLVDDNYNNNLEF